jgi:hypothetical protein
MAFDPAKLPDENPLKLSQVIHLIAFGEARDNDEMERAGYPSARSYGDQIERLYKLCKDEAANDPRCSAFSDMFRKGIKWVADRPVATRLHECEASWPPSGKHLHQVIARYEQERAEEDQKLAAAVDEIRAALRSGKVAFKGRREPGGKREGINLDLFAGLPTIDWRTESIEVPSHKWGAKLGEPLVWEDVNIDLPSFVEWRSGRRCGAEEPSIRREKKKRGPKPNHSETAIVMIARHIAAKPKVQGVTPAREKLIDAIRNRYKEQWPTLRKPGRYNVQRALDKHGWP